MEAIYWSWVSKLPTPCPDFEKDKTHYEVVEEAANQIFHEFPDCDTLNMYVGKDWITQLVSEIDFVPSSMAECGLMCLHFPTGTVYVELDPTLDFPRFERIVKVPSPRKGI